MVSNQVEGNQEPNEIQKQFIEQLQAYIDAAGIDYSKKSLVDVKCVYEFRIIDDDNDERKSQEWKPYFITVDMQTGRVYLNRSMFKPDVSFSIREKDLKNLLLGELDTAQAYLNGKLKIIGNTAAAFKFQRFMIEGRRNNQILIETKNDQNNLEKLKKEDSANLSKPEKPNQTFFADGLKSDVLFELLRFKITYEPDLMKSIKCLVQMNFTKNGTLTATWTLDTKTSGGRIYRAPPSNGTKPDVIVTVEDEDYIQILFGKQNPQRAFMSGKMKVKGNIMLLNKLNQFWNEIQKNRRDPEYSFVKSILLKTSLKSGLQSEMVFFIFLHRLVRLAPVLPPNTVFQINITQNNMRQVSWMIFFDQHSRVSSVKHKTVEKGNALIKSIINPNIELEIDDQEFVKLIVRSDYDLQQALSSNQFKFFGNLSLVPKVFELFQRKLSKPEFKSKL